MARPPATLAALVLALGCLSACGGGSGEAPAETELVVLVAPEIARTAEGDERLRDDTQPLRVGNIDGKPHRLLLRFSLAEIPVGATLVRAELEIQPSSVKPDAVLLGDLIVRAIDMGPTVDLADASKTGPPAGDLNGDGIVGPIDFFGDWDVTARTRQLIDLRAESADFLVHFEGDVGDYGTPLFAEFDQGTSSGSAYRMRLYWQLAY